MDTPASPPNLLTPEEAAHVLGLSQNALKLLRARGEGPAFYRITARTIRYSHDAVVEWLLAKREEPAQ